MAPHPHSKMPPPAIEGLDPIPVDCAVLIVTYNSAAYVGDLLDSLPAAAGGLSLRTVVVDNRSTDGTVALVRGRPQVPVHRGGRQPRVCGVINLARRHAGPVRMHPERSTPTSSWRLAAIARLAATLRDPSMGVAVPMILDSSGKLELTCRLRFELSLSRAIGDAVFGHHLPSRPGWLSETVRDGERAYGYRHPVDLAGGAAAIISAACDAAVGPWDERFFLYSEEVDYVSPRGRCRFPHRVRTDRTGSTREGGSGSSPALVALQAVDRIRYVAKRGRGSGAFRAAVALHELLRAYDPAHRFALRTVLRRSSLVSVAPRTGLVDLASIRSARRCEAPCSTRCPSEPIPPHTQRRHELELGADPPSRTAIQA